MDGKHSDNSQLVDHITDLEHIFIDRPRRLYEVNLNF